MQRIVLFIFLLLPLCVQAEDGIELNYPEQDLIDALLSKEQPEAIVFLVMEYDEEALTWVLPRVLHYTRKLRQRWAGLEIIILSHGDEMVALQTEYQDLYPVIHQQVKELISEYELSFQVCGTYARMSDISESQFPSYIDVVPFAPAEIENYRIMGYQMLHLEQTW